MAGSEDAEERKVMEDIAREAVVSGTANAVAPKHFNFLQPH